MASARWRRWIFLSLIAKPSTLNQLKSFERRIDRTTRQHPKTKLMGNKILFGADDVTKKRNRQKMAYTWHIQRHTHIRRWFCYVESPKLRCSSNGITVGVEGWRLFTKVRSSVTIMMMVSLLHFSTSKKVFSPAFSSNKLRNNLDGCGVEFVSDSICTRFEIDDAT